MSFHPLSNETGGSAYDAMVEKNRIIKILNEFADFDAMSITDRGFVEQMENEDQYVSPKQLLWLRSIKEKYCD